MLSLRHLVLQCARTPIIVIASFGAVACIFQSPIVKQVDLKNPPVTVTTPVKAHLFDGSTIVFPNGVTLSENIVRGAGTRYAAVSAAATPASPISLDSIVGMEAYDRQIAMGRSVVASTTLAVVGAAGAIVLAKALFGSCPTFYADSAGTELLQAEGFSFSVAPLFEQRDVDKLRLTPTGDGRVVLNVRNEALETHYINHLELLEVRHGPSELAFPDQRGFPVAVRNPRTADTIRDRAGRNIASIISATDNVVYSSHDDVVRNVSATDLDDYIDISVRSQGQADSLAVILDMRNSLLNTVLLYDHILGNPGLKSLDWLGEDLGNISTAVDLGRWYTANMGMRISVREGNSFRQVARIGDSGPIAFHKIALIVPAIRNDDDMVHIRLSFVADDWRIDAIGIAEQWRRPESRRIPVTNVAMSAPSQNSPAAASIREADTEYLITTPGQSFRVEFDVGAGDTSGRSWMLASQGYYTEWVRGAWIKSASGKPFSATNETLVEAIRGWRSKQAEIEQRFYSTRISTR